MCWAVERLQLCASKTPKRNSTLRLDNGCATTVALIHFPLSVVETAVLPALKLLRLFACCWRERR
jgi:hypothetical protein